MGKRAPAPVAPPVAPPERIPERILLLGGPADGREVPGWRGRFLKLIRGQTVALYEREPGKDTARFYTQVGGR